MVTLGNLLPCGHQHVRHSGEHGAIRRVCATCKRSFLGTVVRSEVSSHVGTEVLRIEWKEVRP